MDRQPACTGAASLERIASALERISGLLETIGAGVSEPSALPNACTEAMPGAVWRRRTVTSGRVEPPSSPFRPLRILRRSRLYDYLAFEAAVREPRPWVDDVGIALAMTAAVLAGDWWLLPALALCAWWWCPSEWPWTCVLPLMSAAFGVFWVALGVGLFDGLPVVDAGLIWAAIAAGFACTMAFGQAGDESEGDS
jgi:hypothetical protein